MGAKPEHSSSINNNASETLPVPETALLGNKRLVTAVFKKTVMLTVGIWLPAATLAPPVQVRVTSPVCSV